MKSINVEQLLQDIQTRLSDLMTLSLRYEQKRGYRNPTRQIEERGVLQLRKPGYYRRYGDLYLPDSRTGVLRKGAPIIEQIADGKSFWQLRTTSGNLTYEHTSSVPVEPLLTELTPVLGFFNSSQSHQNRVQQARRKKQLQAIELLGEKTIRGISCQQLRYVLQEPRRTTEILLAVTKGARVIYSLERAEAEGVQTEVETFLTETTPSVPLSPKAFQVVLPSGARPYIPPPPLLTAGTVAPEWKLALLGSEKTPVSLSQCHSKVVLLDFWATWCVPCIKSFPTLEAFAARYSRQELEVFLIPVWDNPDSVERWYRENALRYPHLRFLAGGAEADQVAKAYHITQIPQQYTLDSQRRVFTTSSDRKSTELLLRSI